MKETNQKFILAGIILTILLAFIALTFITVTLIPDITARLFGPPGLLLDNSNRILYSTKLFLNRDLLLTPYSSSGSDHLFIIKPGETAADVVEDLSNAKLIKAPEIFKDYLVYKGIDRLLQAGTFLLNPSMNPIEIAAAVYDANPQDVAFYFLAGWRAEEIAALLPTSGLKISIEDFLSLVHNPPKSLSAFISPEITSLEGFLSPGNYQVLKSVTVEELIRQLLMNFSNRLPTNYEVSLKKTGLSLDQAIILASIVEKETILPEEAPIIASVFINRLNAGMPLQSDPTVQYALGFSIEQKTWWKNPLTSEDLSIDSPFNTYLFPGLPPTPICNPKVTAISAVLNPADTDFIFFRAVCDGTGKHTFNSTYEDHLKAACE
ncbi:MAG: endolytic transglycosylase MltG [Pelolinea sp.]|nr:endolytic transglycosylase MltG [Pelolinea sp.]